MSIRVVLVEGEQIVREGLRALLELAPDIRVIGDVEDMKVDPSRAQAYDPDVVVLNMGLPTPQNLTAIRQMVQLVAPGKVLVLSCHEESDYREWAAKAGAAGFLTRRSAGHDLLRAIRAVHAGNSFFQADSLSNDPPRHAQGHKLAGVTPVSALTEREVQVLRMIADGSSNKHIADALQISIKTVEKHRQCLMNKVHIHHTAGLTRYAVCKGIVSARMEARMGRKSQEVAE